MFVCLLLFICLLGVSLAACGSVCPDSGALGLFGLGRGEGARLVGLDCLPVSYITFRVAGGYRKDGGPRLGSFCQTGDAGGRTGRRGRRLGRVVCRAAGLCQRSHAALSYGLVLEPASHGETKQRHSPSERGRASHRRPQAAAPRFPQPLQTHLPKQTTHQTNSLPPQRAPAASPRFPLGLGAPRLVTFSSQPVWLFPSDLQPTERYLPGHRVHTYICMPVYTGHQGSMSETPPPPQSCFGKAVGRELHCLGFLSPQLQTASCKCFKTDRRKPTSDMIG